MGILREYERILSDKKDMALNRFILDAFACNRPKLDEIWVLTPVLGVSLSLSFKYLY